MTDFLNLAGYFGPDAGGVVYVLELLLRATVILLVAILAIGILRRSSASLRHSIWALSLVGVLLLPFFYAWFPAWNWAILPRYQVSELAVASAVTENLSSEASVPVFEGPVFPESSMGFQDLGTDLSGSDLLGGEPSLSEEIPLEPMVLEEDTGSEVASVVSSEPVLSVPRWSWPKFFGGFWAVGTLAGMVWLGIGVLGAWVIARRARPVVGSRWSVMLRELVSVYGCRRSISIRRSAGISVPMTWGIWRPVILIPTGSDAWSEETCRSVLLHELGHIRRGDCLTYLLGRLACVVYWFHPLVWLVARKLRKASEQAADDMVLSSSIAPPDYANHLVDIASRIRGRSLLGHVALPMASKSDLENRVLAILDPRRSRRSLKRKTCYALIALAAFVLAPCALLRLGYAESTSAEPISTNSEVRSELSTSESDEGVSASTDGKQQEQESTDSEKVTVDVLVVNPDGSLAAGAEVFAQNSSKNGRSCVYRTNEDGQVSIPWEWCLLGRAFNLFARHGESVGWHGYQDGNGDLAKGPRKPVKIVLSPCNQVVEGTCVDAKGEPLADVAVCVTVLQNANTGTVRSYYSTVPEGHLGKATTDAKGHYRIKVPEYRLCSVIAKHPWHLSREVSYRPDSLGAKQVVLRKPAGMIRGQVIDKKTGKPVCGAMIGAQAVSQDIDGRHSWNAAVTDEEGQYTLGGMAPGFWNVLFLRHSEKPDWTAVAADSLEVKAGEVSQADFRAGPGRVISGKVINDEDGSPLEGIAVGYYGTARPRSGAACIMESTDHEGRFKFHVPSGKSRVYIAQEFLSEKSSRELIVEPNDDPAPIVFKGKEDPNASAVLDYPSSVALGGEGDKNEEQAYTIRGTLRSSDGKPIPSAMVQVLRPGRSDKGEDIYQSYQTFLATDGKFETFLSIRAFNNKGERNFESEDRFNQGRIGKRWYLVVDAGGYARPEPVEFIYDKEIEPVEIVLKRPVYVPVRGRVLDEKGQPVAKANVSVSLTTVGESVESPWGPEYFTDQDGRFELKHVYQGNRFAVRIEKENYSVAMSPRKSAENTDPIDLGDLRLKLVNSNVIQEGIGWRKVRVGLTREKLIEVLGKPDGNPSANVLRWAGKHLEGSFHSGSAVVSEVRFQEGFDGALQNGITFGSAWADMVKLYGEPEYVTDHRNGTKRYEYSSKGVMFWVTHGKVTQIVVFKPYKLRMSPNRYALEVPEPRVKPLKSSFVYKPFPGDEKLTEEQRLYCRWDAKQFGVPDPVRLKNLGEAERNVAEARFMKQLSSVKESERLEAIDRLVELGSKRAVAPILKIAADRKEKGNWDRHTAIRALGMFGDKSVVPELVHLTYHYNWNTRQWAQISLVRLTGQNFGNDVSAWREWWKKQGGEPPISSKRIVWATSQQMLSMLKGGEDPANHPEHDRRMVEMMTSRLGEVSRPKDTKALPLTKENKEATSNKQNKAKASHKNEKDSKETSVNKFTIPVHAVDAESGEPLEGVQLTLVVRNFVEQFTWTKRLETDADGDTIIEVADLSKVGPVGLMIKLPGYVPQTMSWQIQRYPQSLPESITLTLEKGTSIGGTIQDASGKPVAEATVTVRVAHEDSNAPDHIEKLSTDREGKWRCDVAPKKDAGLFVTVGHPDFYKGLALVSEEMRQRRHVLRLERSKAVKGRVLDKTGKPIENAKVAFLFSDETCFKMPVTKTDSQGNFTLKSISRESDSRIVEKLQKTHGTETLLLDSEIRVVVWCKGFAPQYQEIDVVKENEPMEFRLESGRTIRGQVVDPEGNPISHVSCRALWQNVCMVDSVRCDDHGRFVWDGAPDDKVVLLFGARGWAGKEQAFLPSAEEQTVTLYRPLVVRGTVSDAETGRPIPCFRLTWNEVSDSDAAFSKWSAAGKNGCYEACLDRFRSPTNYLHVEADGYERAVSRKFDQKEGPQTYDFKLKKIKSFGLKAEKKTGSTSRAVPKAFLEKMLSINRRWLRPDPSRLSYTFSLEHPGKNDRIRYRVEYRSPDKISIEETKGDQVSKETAIMPPPPELLMGIYWYGPVQAFAVSPEDYAVTIVGEESLDGVDVWILQVQQKEYLRTHENAFIVDVGCGLHKTYYGRIGNRVDMDRLWVEKTTGRILREEAFGKETGSFKKKPSYTVTYGDFEKTADGGQVPRHVVVDLKVVVDSKHLDWTFDMTFQLLDKKVWFFKELKESQGDKKNVAIAKITDASASADVFSLRANGSLSPKVNKSASQPAKSGIVTPALDPVVLTAFGKVVDPAGKPVEGATVYLREWSTYRISSEPYNQNLNDIFAATQTDAEGAFRFESVRAKSLPGEWLEKIPWDVVVVAKPYAVAWQHLHTAKSTKPMMIQLSPEAKITGQVRDEQERPIKEASVTVYYINPLVGSSERFLRKDPESLDLQLSRLAMTAKTDEKGNVTVDGLPADRLVDVIVKSDDHRRSFLRVATTKQPQADLEVMSHRDGKTTTERQKVFSSSFSATLKAPPLPRIVGQVVAADTKKPMAGLKVWNLDALGAVTDREGRFVIEEVGRSPCRLLVHVPEGSDYLKQLVHVETPEGKKEVPVTIELVRGETISGKVVDRETGNGIEGVHVSFDNGFDINKAKIGGSCPGNAKTDRTGLFRLAVPDGKGKLRIHGPVSGYDFPPFSDPPKDVKGFFEEVDVVAGSPVSGVEFTVSRDNPVVASDSTMKTIQGTVFDLDGKPAADVEVGIDTWFHDFIHNGRQSLVKTDQDGHFSFKMQTSRMPNGAIMVVAVDRKRKLRGHAEARSAITVGAIKKSVKVFLFPTGVVTGHVLEGGKVVIGKDGFVDGAGMPQKDAKPIANAKVQLGQGSARDWADADENGRFEFPMVEAGSEFGLTVYDKNSRYMHASFQGHVAKGQTLEVGPFYLVKLDKAVAGTVVDSDGNPVEGVTVRAELGSINRWIPGASAKQPTGKDGRFVIRGVPDALLRLVARTKTHSVRVDVKPGDVNTRIVFEPGAGSEE